jgi:hypothetical protein
MSYYSFYPSGNVHTTEETTYTSFTDDDATEIRLQMIYDDVKPSRLLSKRFVLKTWLSSSKMAIKQVDTNYGIDGEVIETRCYHLTSRFNQTSLVSETYLERVDNDSTLHRTEYYPSGSLKASKVETTMNNEVVETVSCLYNEY